MATLPDVNHYGIPYSPEDKQNHLRVVPVEATVPDVIERIISASPRETVASFALRNGMDALFES
ncbi:hypothetical protein KBB49_00125 [Candidatus Saccharibacteria bacterium]|jgi:hypothetical protein|nr:hypothetical protein [Candidatus Saccharibacteria bacterium]